MTRWAYARCSTSDQDTAAQVHALQEAGCTRIVEEIASGTDDSRPLLARLIEEMEPGDTLVVTKLDRVARSLRHLLEILDVLKRRKAFFRALSDPVDTSSPSGRLMIQLLGAVGEFEASLIRERTMAGLENARRHGRVGGNPALIRRDPEALRKKEESNSRAIRRNDIAMLERIGPAIKLMRPALTWADTRRAIEVLYPIKLPDNTRLQRLAAVGVRERMLSERVLEGTRHLAKDWRHVHLIYALDKLAPEGTVKDLIDALWKMQEPSPTGGRRWTELQALTALSKGRDLLDKRKVLAA